MPDAGKANAGSGDSDDDDDDDAGGGAPSSGARATSDAASAEPNADGEVDASDPLIPPADDDAEDSADAGSLSALLFPSNCKAPWEESTKYHPEGYGAHEVHGLESNLNKDNCASCHGDQLQGCANSPSCDNCHDGGHPNGWRRNCIYCHGGDEDLSGAPPRDMDGVSTKESLSFLVHTSHVTETIHAPYSCETCHEKYADAMDPGHMYDDTPGTSEVTFTAELTKGASYSEGTCTNIYCHGDGKTPGNSEHTDPELDCSGCHAEAPLTGQHPSHTFFNPCRECHTATVDETLTIVGPSNHVNGKVDLTMPDSNMRWDGETCTGICHIIGIHDARVW